MPAVDDGKSTSTASTPSTTTGTVAPPRVAPGAAGQPAIGQPVTGQPADIEAILSGHQAKGRAATIRRRLLRWGVPLLVIAAIVMYVATRSKAPAVRYATVDARRGDLAVSVTATGTLAALDTVDVGTEVSGVVDVVNVDYNDRVYKGQTLAVVNTDQLQAQIQQGEAALQAAQATAQQTAATVAELTPQQARAESLFKARMISQQDLDGARAALARAVAAEANARALIDASQASLQAQRTLQAKATIRSPISGVVLQRQIEPGRTVASAFQTPVLFVLAADLKRMTLALDVDEADVGQVRAGQEADFTVDAYPDRTFNATVLSVRNAAKTVEGVVTYQAILQVANPDLALRPGMTATARIKTAQVHDALLVPNAALRFTPTIDTSSSSATQAPSAATRRGGATRTVWTLRDGAPHALTITVGMTDTQWTAVTGGDVQAGTPLITGVLDATTAKSADTASTNRPAAPPLTPRVR